MAVAYSTKLEAYIIYNSVKIAEQPSKLMPISVTKHTKVDM